MKMKKLWILTAALLFSCNGSEDGDYWTNLNDLPVNRPVQLIEFDHVEGIFFSHLNYTTEAASNGDVILNDRQEAVMVRITESGELVDIIARQGRGPGEVGDILSMQMDAAGGIHVYDQQNQKSVYYKPGSYEPTEFSIQTSNGNRVSKMFPIAGTTSYFVIERNLRALIDDEVEPVTSLRVYERTEDSTRVQMNFPAANYASLVIDGNVMGGAPVPFGPEFLFDMSADKQSFFVSWNENSQIVELNSELDTIRTLDVKLERLPISENELSDIEEEFSDHHPNQLQSVIDLLPNRKVSYDEFIVDYQNRIWLKLTRWNENDQEWLILSEEGEPMKRVLLPREGMLTHVSEHHLGFRKDDHLFALFEAVD
jgi:hypothetical protein